MGRHRLSSEPLLSGDTFRSMASIVFENYRWKRMESGLPEVLFAKADYADSDSFLRKCEGLIKRNHWQWPRLIIHNGDVVPGRERFVALSNIFHRVFSVNVTQSSWPVSPLPIGLENVWHGLNGKMEIFLRNSSIVSETESHPPVKDFGLSFRVSTNLSIRIAVRKLFTDAGFEFQEPLLSPESYARWVSSYKFIISPPGNGLDCHRTWEAIYLGAVPVVLKSTLHPILFSKLPMWAVDSYDEVINFPAEKLGDKFLELRNRPLDMSLCGYWKGELQRKA